MHAGSSVSNDDGMGGGAEPVVVVSPTIQEFLGVRYYLCGRYFQRKGVRLHRKVWEHHRGPIPAGHDVHHRENDRSRNQIGDLLCLPESAHGRLHMLERSDESRGIIERIRHKAVEWHGSDAGREWHREQYRLHCAPALLVDVEGDCRHCGRRFVGKKQSEYCSNNCKSAFRRASGVDNEGRKCVVCGLAFVVNRYSKAKCCSRECGATASARTRTGVPQRRA